MTEPTPKYHIGDTVWIVSNEPGADVLKKTVAVIHMYSNAVYYTVIEPAQDIHAIDPRGILFAYSLKMLEADCYATKEEAEKRVAELSVIKDACTAAYELKVKEEELAELKEYLPENLQKKISKLEAEIKELKGKK